MENFQQAIATSPFAQFLLGVLASLLAAVIWAGGSWWNYRREAKKRIRSFRGEWETWWQPVSPESPPWIGQRMQISIGYRKIRFTSVPNGRIDRDARQNKEKEYNWAGEMQLSDQIYLYGSWHKLDGPGCGAFVLLRTSDGDCLCGYIIGHNLGNDVRMGPFVLAKDRRNVLIGMRWLRENWRAFEPPEEMRAKL